MYPVKRKSEMHDWNWNIGVDEWCRLVKNVSSPANSILIDRFKIGFILIFSNLRIVCKNKVYRDLWKAGGFLTVVKPLLEFPLIFVFFRVSQTVYPCIGRPWIRRGSVLPVVGYLCEAAIILFSIILTTDKLTIHLSFKVKVIVN